MKQFNKKQKIIFLIVLAIVSIGICYYVYAQEEKMEENNLETFEEIEEIEEVTKGDSEIEEKIIVYITGAVNQEGVIELEENSRISDAIEKAGGLKEKGEIKNINLAYKLEDGMKIYIPTKEEVEMQEKQQEKQQENTQTVSTESGINVENSISNNSENSEVLTNVSGGSGTNGGASTSVNQKININTATQEQLETLPGIGTVTAQKIIAYRKENGKFKTKEDIKNVSGIGDAKFNKIKELIGI